MKAIIANKQEIINIFMEILRFYFSELVMTHRGLTEANKSASIKNARLNN